MKRLWDMSAFLRATGKSSRKTCSGDSRYIFICPINYLGRITFAIMDNLEKERWGQETRVVAAVPMAALVAEGAQKYSNPETCKGLHITESQAAWEVLEPFWKEGEPVVLLIDLSPFQPLCSWVNLPRIGLANRNIGIPQCWVREYNWFISLLCRVILSSFFLTERIKVPKWECGELDTSSQAQQTWTIYVL